MSLSEAQQMLASQRSLRSALQSARADPQRTQRGAVIACAETVIVWGFGLCGAGLSSLAVRGRLSAAAAGSSFARAERSGSRHGAREICLARWRAGSAPLSRREEGLRHSLIARRSRHEKGGS
jgi:hypothetical protein